MRLLVWVFLAVLALLPQAALAQAVAYQARLDGVEGNLRERVAEASRLIQLADEPPASLVSLRRRAEGDVGRIEEVLRAEGHYAGTVTLTIAEDEDPVRVVLAVTPGPAFILSRFDVRLESPPGTEGPGPVPLSELGIDTGIRARAAAVVDAQGRLLQALAERGYPLARVADRRAVVDHAATTMNVELLVDTGPRAAFGALAVEGLAGLEPDWVRNRVPWDEGERFSVTQVEEMRKRLVASRLFSSVKLSTGTEVDEQGRLPITVQLTEADHRSIGASVTWSSNEGFGTEAFWEHRNLFGAAERLRTALVVSEIRNAVDVTFRKPDLLIPDQDLVSSFVTEEQRTEAYVTRTVGTQAGLEWLLSPTWRASAATALERTYEERDESVRRFTLLSFPLEVRHDSSDDLLDPGRGNRLRVQLRPFVEALGGTAGFVRTDVQDSHYLRLSPRMVLAGWGRIAAIRGAALEEVPADRRLYVGGAGSVRAFGYQLAGPVDDAGDPTGGLSALAFGVELRAKVTDTIGLVPFVEAGNAFAGKWPEPDDGLLWGAGLGLRYHTAIGPLRADFAIPINRRHGIDDAFQITLSLGQAF